jgi:hypothetical protein
MKYWLTLAGRKNIDWIGLEGKYWLNLLGGKILTVFGWEEKYWLSLTGRKNIDWIGLQENIDWIGLQENMFRFLVVFCVNLILIVFRVSNLYCEQAYHLLITQLEKGHSEIRLSSFQMIEELFNRSHYFRELLISNFQHFLELTVGRLFLVYDIIAKL